LRRAEAASAAALPGAWTEAGGGGAEGQSPHLVLELVDDALGELGADSGGAGDHGVVAARHGAVEIVAGKGRQDGEGDPGPDALDGDQQPEPVALVARGEADQADVVLADLHDGVEDDLAAGRAERGERPRRGEDEIAHAVDVDDRMVGGEAVEEASKLGDHGRRRGR
jgi:hypothetical protein